MTTHIEEQPEIIDRARYRKILWFFSGVLVNVVWWDLLVGQIFKSWVRRGRPERYRRMARRFREVAIEMGGVMIKLGQFLSARVDVLPPEITEELSGLQDEVPPVPFNQIEIILSAELGDVDDHFTHFWAEPLAAASLGQAHRARLVPEVGTNQNPNAKDVVVKVQRPKIEDIVRTDLAALSVVSRGVMRYKPIRKRADVPALLAEFSETMWEELDYVSEADNAERFAEIFADDPGVRIPAVYRRHSTRRVLVLEDVSGIKITDKEALEEADIDQGEVAIRLMDAYFKQIFEEGFFHADPHPGNLFIQPIGPADGGANGQKRPFRLSFVDFGMVGHIEELMGENLRRVLVAVTQRDARELTLAFKDLGFFLPGSDLERITEAQEQILDQMWGRNLAELSQPDPEEIQEFSREFRDIMFEFPFQVPQDFIFFGRAMGMLSGLASQLDPSINPWQLVEKYGRNLMGSQAGVEFGLATISEWLRVLLTLPAQVERVLVAAESGRLRVQSTQDRALLRRLDRIERRISRPNWSLIVAALLLCGTVFYVAGEETLGYVSWGLAGLFLILSLIPRD